MEFLNRFVTVVRRDRISSIKLINKLLRGIILMALYIIELKRILEANFGRLRLGEYLVKDVAEDI